jgi:hypothetical protein
MLIIMIIITMIIIVIIITIILIIIVMIRVKIIKKVSINSRLMILVFRTTLCTVDMTSYNRAKPPAYF